MKHVLTRIALVVPAVALAPLGALASDTHTQHSPGAIYSDSDASKIAGFDILAAHIHRDGRLVTFHMTTAGQTGTTKPAATGALAGAEVHSYVWPISLDPAVVGFDAEAGILAFAATSHPDFDDTPLYDENADGDPGNDGGLWHSHWVVLAPDEACGDGALAVRDIPEGTTPALPLTWPGLPLLIDSPGYTPLFDGSEITVTVPFSDPSVPVQAAYDGVTAALRINASLHAPLLCVSDVFDVASGDLSLPGRID